MHHPSISAFLKTARALPPGPVAILLAEDGTALERTIAHHRKLGFAQIVVLGDATLPACDAPHVRVDFDALQPDALPIALNALMPALDGRWVHAGYNAEFLFFPFCGSRRISEMTAFLEEERRGAALCFVIDLYAADLDRHPDAVALNDAFLDRTGYHAHARPDPDNHNFPKERQLDFNGGLRWRFWDHIPKTRRRIDRVTLFRAERGLRMRPDLTLNDEERNTYTCEWHNSLTVSVASFRTAKALALNPGSRAEIKSFMWPGSVRFDWSDRQLLDLGLMEPGQWF